MRRNILILALLLLMAKPAFSAVTTFDNTFVANDVFSSDFHTRLNANFSKSLTGGINNISTANIVDDTLTEADMADEINPRVRTYEGAACEFVYTGLLPVTSGTLSTTIGSGTAYPRGYRINKASSTAHSFTASKWTYVDIDQNGDFQYSEVAIGGSTPSVASNSIRLAKVSSDTSTVNTVTDLRRTSCANGPFSAISDTASEATLADVLQSGAPVRRFSNAGRTPQGFVQGFNVSYDTVSTFKVTAGSAYINGKYRAVSTDTTVTTSTDSPQDGTSGLDTGTVTGGPLQYCVYAVADQDSVKTPSFTYSTNCTAPAGVTNSRLIGSIRTDATNLFTSRDVVTAHSIANYETPFAWIRMEGNSGAPKIQRSFNISTLTENATGAWTVTFNNNPVSADYAVVQTCGSGGTATGNYLPVTGTITTSSTKFFCMNTAGATVTTPDVSAQFFGDNRK